MCADHSVWHAAHVMLSERVSGLPVLDDDQSLVGIVTEGDPYAVPNWAVQR